MGTAARSKRLVFGETKRVTSWAAERIRHFAGWGTDPEAIGSEVNGELVSAVVYTNFSGKNVWASIVCEAPIDRRFLYAMFWNPFVTWECNHISCAIERWNEASLRLNIHMGFQVEGKIREAAADGGDIIITGLLKRECRFLDKRPR